MLYNVHPFQYDFLRNKCLLPFLREISQKLILNVNFRKLLLAFICLKPVSIFVFGIIYLKMSYFSFLFDLFNKKLMDIKTFVSKVQNAKDKHLKK